MGAVKDRKLATGKSPLPAGKNVGAAQVCQAAGGGLAPREP